MKKELGYYSEVNRIANEIIDLLNKYDLEVYSIMDIFHNVYEMVDVTILDTKLKIKKHSFVEKEVNQEQ